MTTLDLGDIGEPVLLCGGAYSNMEAFEAMIEAARRRGVAPVRIIHSGDIVAYCADPAGTTRALAACGAVAIKGNVEIQIAGDADDCGCGFAEGSACSAMSGAWYAHTRAALASEPDLRAFMAGLPDRIVFTMAGLSFHVLHGAASAVNRHMFASMPDEEFAREIALAGDPDVVIGGHSGLPFTRTVGRRLWHNAGALGMPANDGTARVWISLLSPQGAGIKLEHVPLGYDHWAAAAKMRRAGLPEGYASALETGLWPSLDTLPEVERTASGRALSGQVHRLDRPTHPARKSA